MSESMTSTGPAGPRPKPASQPSGSSQTSSLAETSKRLNSKGADLVPSTCLGTPPTPYRRQSLVGPPRVADFLFIQVVMGLTCPRFAMVVLSFHRIES